MLRFVSAASAAAIALSIATSAQALEIKDAWSRASAGMARAGAAFMTIDNTGGEADRVVAASAPVSDITELHTHTMDGDVMRMRQVPDITVPAGETVVLQPGGLHVMFMKLAQPLKEGDTFPVTLTFEKAGEKTVDVTVQAPGAMGAMGGMKHGAMKGMSQ